MDIRKISQYSAELIIGCGLGLGFFILQMGVLLVTSKSIAIWPIAFFLHFINGLLILGVVVVSGYSLFRRWRTRRRVLADSIILCCAVLAIWYIWVRG